MNHTTVEVEQGGHRLLLDLSPAGERLVLNRFWLRDHCPSLPTKASGLRTFSVASLPENLHIKAAALDEADAHILIVDWSDGHVSRYELKSLAAVAQEATGQRPPLRSVRHLAGTEQPAIFDAAGLDYGTIAHHDLLDAIVRDGFVLVDGMEHEDASTERLAALLGRVRETDFGRFFDIVTEPEAWTLSQSTKGQDPHSDDPFRYTPSGISILHCREPASGGGGTSIIVDGFKVAEDLRREEPEHFELLCSVTIPYLRHRSTQVEQGEDVHMVAYAPVITRSGQDVVGLRFHERSTGVFDLDPAIVDAYYLAFRSFAVRVRSADYHYTRRLKAGEAVVFDNQRMLHGRTGYESDAAGRRHMRLCTVDRDQTHSRLRRLKEVHGLDGITQQRLHPGSAAY